MYAIKRAGTLVTVLASKERADKFAEQLSGARGRPHSVSVATPADIAAYNEMNGRNADGSEKA